MSIRQDQQEAFEAVRAFNAAVTTSRLYPAASPQVKNGVEKAYRTIKAYARKHGELSFGKDPEGPLIAGRPAGAELGSELERLAVYRHLDLLELSFLALKVTFDRKAFANLLTVFTAKFETIKREGGGRSFVHRLGLDRYFPEGPIRAPEEPVLPQLPAVETRITFNDLQPGLLGYLFGEHNRNGSKTALLEIVKDPEQTSNIVLAATARLFRELTQAKGGGRPVVFPPYGRFMQNINRMMGEGIREETARTAAGALLDQADDFVLSVLYVQEFPPGFPERLFDLLVERAAGDRFDAVVRRYRGMLEPAPKEASEGAVDPALIERTLQKLLATGTGRQFLGREKARSLLKNGEEQRRGKRLETSIALLLSGKGDVLNNEEVLVALPAEIDKLFKQGEAEKAGRLVETVAARFERGAAPHRQPLIHSLVRIGEMLYERKHWEQLETVAGALLSWLSESHDDDHVFEKAAFLLQAVMNRAWDRRTFEQGDRILALFHKIRSKELSVSPQAEAVIGRMQDRFYNRLFLAEQLERYLGETSEIESGDRLSKMGRPAAVFLIEKLLLESESSHWQKLTVLLERMGSISCEAAMERLPDPMPWYGKRNLLKLIGATGWPELADDLIVYLRHDDIRVQQETLACVYAISGERRKKALLGCLEKASEAMLGQIVKVLAPYRDDETAVALGTVLQDQENYSEKIREPLVLETIRSLSRSNSKHAAEALRSFLDNRKRRGNRRLAENVWLRTEAALKQLEGAPTRAGEKRQGDTVYGDAGASSGGSGQGRVGRSKPVVQDFDRLPGFAEINRLLKQDDTEAAKKKIMTGITASARAGRFEEAQRLREWLIAIDSLALTEIIRAAEIIEEQKIAAIGQDQIEAWSDLHEKLSVEEFATFYHAMERRVYESETTIAEQGDINPGLYFINSGAVKLYFKQQGGQTLVKTAGRGEVLGAETVFDASVWTVGAAALSRVEIMFLSVERLNAWREDCPALESKLHDHCIALSRYHSLFEATGEERRAAKRYALSGRVVSMLLDDKGDETGISSRGDLIDISLGGLSFHMRISQKAHARLLLGRRIRIAPHPESPTAVSVAGQGVIIAVRGGQAVENEYSVHVRFDEEISSSQLQELLKAGQRLPG